MTQPQKKREGKLLLRDHFLRYQNNLQQTFKEKMTQLRQLKEGEYLLNHTCPLWVTERV